MHNRRPPPSEQPALTVKLVSPILVVNPNVGDVWESAATIISVRLANTTDKPLYLSRIGGNCNCMHVSPTSAVIPARGELAVSLTYDFTDRVSAELGKLSRDIQMVLSVEVAGAPLKPFVLSGVCRSHVATNTPVMHFGEANARGHPAVSRWLAVNSDTDTATICIVANDDTIQVGTPERHGNGWRVRVTPDHSRIRGRFETTVRVDAVNRVGEVIGSCRVTVDGIVNEPAEHLWEGAHAP